MSNTEKKRLMKMHVGVNVTAKRKRNISGKLVAAHFSIRMGAYFNNNLLTTTKSNK